MSRTGRHRRSRNTKRQFDQRATVRYERVPADEEDDLAEQELLSTPQGVKALRLVNSALGGSEAELTGVTIAKAPHGPEGDIPELPPCKLRGDKDWPLRFFPGRSAARLGPIRRWISSDN